MCPHRKRGWVEVVGVEVGGANVSTTWGSLLNRLEVVGVIVEGWLSPLTSFWVNILVRRLFFFATTPAVFGSPEPLSSPSMACFGALSSSSEYILYSSSYGELAFSSGTMSRTLPVCSTSIYPDGIS